MSGVVAICSVLFPVWQPVWSWCKVCCVNRWGVKQNTTLVQQVQSLCVTAAYCCALFAAWRLIVTWQQPCDNCHSSPPALNLLHP
jgi:hypothetical protein